MKRFFAVCLLVCLAACTSVPDEKTPLELEPGEFQDLPGWDRADHQGVLDAFEKSCGRMAKKSPDQDFGPDQIGGRYADWKEVCAALSGIPKNDSLAIARFFETWFVPYKATAEGYEKGLFTGYYEPGLNGSRVRTDRYNVPLYVRPDDLVMVDLGQFREDLKGRRIAGRVKGGKLVPYESREDIVGGAYNGKKLELVWVDDAVDAFFLQIQGSGQVRLTDGSVIRLGYAGQNGHPYFAIGRALIEREVLTPENVSLQTIRQWLVENPHEADEIMNMNQSYVFFRELDGEGPLGAENVALTPQRSLAVDRTKIPYGVPVWLDAEAPEGDHRDRIQQLVIAQDTGGAIRGAVRGDLFWGAGHVAAERAGKMKSEGRYWLLLPKRLNDDIRG